MDHQPSLREMFDLLVDLTEDERSRRMESLGLEATERCRLAALLAAASSPTSVLVDSAGQLMERICGARPVPKSAPK